MNIITEEINKEIAQDFLIDSQEFLIRYESLKGIQTLVSNRSKLMIDLLFSIECSLKALIFLESMEDEKATYKKIKTHDLKKLCNFINDKTGLLDLEQAIIQNSEIFRVSSRYTLEAKICFRENHVWGELYYNTIANFTWLEELFKVAKKLLDFVNSQFITPIVTINFRDINLDKLIEKGTRINNISKP